MTPHDESCSVFYQAACPACRADWPARERLHLLRGMAANRHLRLMTGDEFERQLLAARKEREGAANG